MFAADSRAAFIALFLGNGLSSLVTAPTVRIAVNHADTENSLPGTPVRPGSAPAVAEQPEPAVRSPFRDGWFMLFALAHGVPVAPRATHAVSGGGIHDPQ
ncbi:hypothetical protein [Streptomyces eurythermus]|uniref:hypothetical protein n=1 Tax=Streptomyces eurythermus TaxID=42237 RepID=UPI0033C9555C